MLVLRFYNPSDQEVEGSFEFHDSFSNISEGKLNEEPVASLNKVNGNIAITVRENQVKTLLLK